MTGAAMAFAPRLIAPGRAWLLTVALAALVAVAATAPAAAQPQRTAAPGASREEGPRWQQLTPARREALAPLEREWPSIDAARKQKWLVLADRLRTLPPGERARIGERMSDWARLTPAERGQARLRYEEMRGFPAPDREARWRAYQALSPEEKKRLAARAANPVPPPAHGPAEAAHPNALPRAGRVGRDPAQAKVNLVPNPALAQPPRPIAPTVVQATPGATTTLINRRPAPPAHQQTGMPKIATTPEFVNRGTLLPRRGPQAAAVVAPPGPAHPAPAATRNPTAAPVPLPSPSPSGPR